MATPESINAIIDAVFAIPDPVVDASRRDMIHGFVKTTVNGDTVVDHLAINASLGKDQRGILVYVLTNRRLVKFEIPSNDVKSVSHPIDTITGVERTLEGDRAAVQITFQNGSFGLRYAASNKKIEEFFQKVDQCRSGAAN